MSDTNSSGGTGLSVLSAFSLPSSSTSFASIEHPATSVKEACTTSVGSQLDTMRCSSAWPSGLTRSNPELGQGSKSRRLAVHPAHLLYSPVLNRLKRVCFFLPDVCESSYAPIQLPVSGLQRDTNMRLSAIQLRAQRLRNLSQLSTRRAAAEHQYQQKQLIESFVLMYASDKGQNFSELDPEIGLALARAASNLLEAEASAAQTRIKECATQLLILQETADDINARLEDANHQLGAVLHHIRSEGLPVETHADRGLLSILQSLHIHQLEDSMESGNELRLLSESDSSYTIADYEELTDSGA